jgi:sugar lactone lactonase YvrE
MQASRIQSRPLALPLTLLGAATFALPLSAQHFKKSVLVDKLLSPNGIAVEPSGNLLYTEVPDPGRFGARNTVSRFVMSSKTKQLVVGGEPGPRNISVTPNGDFYWTCDTAGVVFVFDQNGQRQIASGLKTPTGIAATPSGRVFLTLIPDPGKPMMGNEVAELSGGRTTTISMGEPEPVDIVADDMGNLYWTCRTAGVILRYDMATKQKSLVLDGLEAPTGIAMDGMGRLYFTEVPTPAKNAMNGGRNKVWRYDPSSKAMTLISFGEPEPHDVAVTRDGKTVYWTCRSAGVIVKGEEQMDSASIGSTSSGKLGTIVNADLVAPVREAGKAYFAATALGLGPIAIGQRFLALSPDALFFLTLANPAPSVFAGYMGMLDAQGMAKLSHPVPSDPALEGLHLNTAFLVIDPSSPDGLSKISDTLRIRIQK